MEEDGDIFSEFGAHSKVDDGVIKAGRFCKKAGKDAGQVGDGVTTSRPHGNDSIWGPGSNKTCADNKGDLDDRKWKNETCWFLFPHPTAESIYIY